MHTQNGELLTTQLFHSWGTVLVVCCYISITQTQVFNTIYISDLTVFVDHKSRPSLTGSFVHYLTRLQSTGGQGCVPF